MTESEQIRLIESTRRDEQQIINAANKIYGVTTLLVPVIVVLGIVITADLIDTGASTLVVICTALFSIIFSIALYALAVMSKLVAKLLGHIADAVLAQQEIRPSDATATSEEVQELTDLLIERISVEIDHAHDAICPSCELEINRHATHCPRCRAIFAEGSPWAPIPK